MNTLVPVAVCLMAAPIDASFLRTCAETRGFLNGRPAKPKITPDGKAVLFLRSDAKSAKQKLFAFDVATKATKELLAPEALLGGAVENETPEEKARRERQRVTAGGFADFHLSPDGKRVLVSLSGRLFVLDRESGKHTELKTGGSAVDPKWSPDGAKVGYVRGFDVYAYDLASDAEVAVTTGGTREKTHGLAEFVAQEEMGRHTGFWWSPDAKHIAYAEADHAGVEVWHIADPLKPDVAPQTQYYPRPGRKNVSVRLGIVPVAGGTTVWAEWDRAKYEYLVDVIWQKYGPLTLKVQDRKQQEAQYYVIETQTGRTAPLCGEFDESFLNIASGSIQWLKTTKHFSWIQQNAKFQVLTPPVAFGFLRSELDDKPDYSGKEDQYSSSLRTFSGDADFREVVAFDPASGRKIYTRSADRPAEGHDSDPTQSILFQFAYADAGDPANPRMVNGKLPVCKQPGVYSGVFQDNLSLSVVTQTTLSALPTSAVYRADWSAIGGLPSVALEPEFKPNVVVEQVGDYWTAVVRPRDFDAKKKYPVIVDVYGGPRHLHVVQAMRNWLIPQWLADQGFVVVAVDNRGTPGRGRDWERSVYKKFGTVPLDDQVKGLHALCAKHPELDRERVGIVGWSFGGYMAANGVLRRSDVFKAAVAGAPVTDWEDYDTHYTERYMGLLPESRAAYDEASLIPLAKGLSRPLLLVHGTADDNVYYRHSLKLADALFRAGRPFESLPLPGVTHMYAADPQVAERLWERTVTFFRGHLGGPN